MCGLVVLRALTPQPDLPTRGRRALNTIAHRGPDDESWQLCGSNNEIFLGHRRLSILDLSTAGRQPLTCAKTGNTLVFNGEIYNFLELREQLQGAGYRFDTDTDTEVILHAWHKWGEGAFNRFNGMWSLVLFDKATGDLVCCRDRLGVKPLYYANTHHVVVLGSEIRAIASALDGYPYPNQQAVFDFLVLGISDHNEQTFYQGISSVPPGYLFRIKAGGATQLKRYHQWPQADTAVQLNVPELHDLVTDAIRIRLRSDAPTVSLLSGGLDSSIITAVSALESTQESRSKFCGAFTYGYAGSDAKDYDEVSLAGDFIKEFAPAMPHYIYRSNAVPREDELFQLVATQEAPFCTPSILASFKMYQEIQRNGFKVALIGEGADEIFGGYTERYINGLVRDHLHAGEFRKAITIVRRGDAHIGSVGNHLVWDLPPKMVSGLLHAVRPNMKIMAGALQDQHGDRLMLLASDRRLNVGDRLWRDITASNLPMVLRFSDRNSMRSGIEARSPFLDYRLVSWARATPAHLRMGDSFGKSSLRSAFAGLLTDKIAWRRKKHGFGQAEQFQVSKINFIRLWDELPSWANEFINVEKLRDALRQPNIHRSIWWSVAVALWLSATYG